MKKIADLIIFLIPILFFITLPLIMFIQRRRELKRKAGNGKAPNDGWSIKGNKEETLPPEINSNGSFPRLSDGEMGVRIREAGNGEYSPDRNPNASLDHITSLPRFKQAIVWKEILGKPLSLRDWD